jgi:protein-S-isoprenylcysteine O-methyltransferase Ste14
VRHPGYAGNIPPLPGIVLALGSVWTLVPAAVALVIAVIRQAAELLGRLYLFRELSPIVIVKGM